MKYLILISLLIGGCATPPEPIYRTEYLEDSGPPATLAFIGTRPLQPALPDCYPSNCDDETIKEWNRAKAEHNIADQAWLEIFCSNYRATWAYHGVRVNEDCKQALETNDQ